MTNETKLLTEAEWHALLGLAYKHAEPTLRERGLIAPEPVDSLFVAMRETLTGFRWAFNETELRKICETAHMELAKPELTREMAELVDDFIRFSQQGSFSYPSGSVQRLYAMRAALTEGQSK